MLGAVAGMPWRDARSSGETEAQAAQGQAWLGDDLRDGATPNTLFLGGGASRGSNEAHVNMIRRWRAEAARKRAKAQNRS